DLIRFGVPGDETEKLKKKFSVLHRPTSYHRSEWTALAGSARSIYGAPALDRVAFELARWLASHHLDKPELLQWVTAQGGYLHPLFADIVLEQVRKGALPQPLTTIWRIVARNVP